MKTVIYSITSIILIFSLNPGVSQTFRTSLHCSPGWQGVVLRGTTYIEPPELICDIVKNGMLRIDPSLANTTYYWSQFELCDTLCTGDEFILQLKMMNGAAIGGIDAYDFGMDIQGENGNASLTLMGNAGAQSLTSIVSGNTIIRNRPELVVDFSDWNIISLKFTKDSLFYNANDKVFFELAQQKPLCNIHKLFMAFKGSGAFDWIKITKLNGESIYFENFEDCHTLINPRSCNEIPALISFQQKFDCKNGRIELHPAPEFKSGLNYVIQPNPNQAGFKDTVFHNLPPGHYNIEITSQCPDTNFQLNFIIPKPLRDSIIHVQHIYCDRPGKIELTGLDGTGPYLYKINNGSYQTHHVFDSLIAGMHSISIRDSNHCEIESIVHIIDSIPPLKVQIDSSNLQITCKDSIPFVALQIVGSFPPFSFVLNDITVQNHGYFKNLKPGKNKIQITDSKNCKQFDYIIEVTDSRVSYFNKDNIHLCYGDSLTIGPYMHNISGNYLDSFKTSSGCDSTVFIQLTVENLIHTEINKELCGRDSLIVENRVFNEEGIYSITLESSRGCDSLITIRIDRNRAINCDSLCDFQIPNVFTPNDDGINDVFMFPSIVGNLISMKIFNRWGNLVYQSSDPLKAWDGFENGYPAQPGTYIYLIEYFCITGFKKMKKGSITLIK